MMDYLDVLKTLFGAGKDFVVTLDDHPLGAVILLLLIVTLCYAFVKRKE